MQYLESAAVWIGARICVVSAVMIKSPPNRFTLREMMSILWHSLFF